MELKDQEILEIIASNEKNYLQERRFKMNEELDYNELPDAKSFLNWFLNKWNKEYEHNCIWVDETAEEKEKNIMQCRGHKNRSTHDLFLLANYYYPSLTLLECICILVELNENLEIYSLQCPQIEARVWYYDNRKDYDKENKYFSSAISHYDDNGTQNGTPRLEVLTDGLNYLHLKQIYEYSKEEVAA